MTGSHRFKTRTASSTRGPRRFTFRPCVEELESRLVPSTSIPLNPFSWAGLGPAPIGNGQVPGNGPVSGRVTGLATDPTDLGIIYAATAGGGIWKTINGGTSWFPTTDNLRFANGAPMPIFMGAVAVAPSNPQVVYAGSGEANNSGDSYYGVGIHVSTNGGASWNLSGPDFNALRGSAIARIVVDQLDPNTAWAAVSNTAVNGTAPPAGTGIYRTTDGGVNWTNVTAATLPGTTAVAWSAVVVDPTTSTVNGGNATLFAAAGNPTGSANNGVYQSTNSGATWALVNNVPSATTGGRIALALAHPAGTANATLYAAIATPTVLGVSNLQAFDVSTDGGTTWMQRTATPPFVKSRGWYDMVLAAHPNNPTTVYAGGNAGPNSIIRSTDGGANWTDLTSDPTGNGPHVDHHALAFDVNGNLFDGNDGGVWRLNSFNFAGIQLSLWTNLNTNLDTIQFTGIALDPGNSNLVYGGTQDNGTDKFADSRAWRLLRGGDGGFVRVDPNNHQTVYQTINYPPANNPATGMPFPFIQRSDDGGQNLTDISAGISLTDTANFYPPYVIDPNNSNRLVLGTSRLYVTPDRGVTAWTTLGSAPSTAAVDSIAIAPSDSNTIYVGAGGALYVTTNNAQNWTTITPPFSSGPFPDIAVDPNNSRTAYVVVGAFTAAGSGAVWQTTDGGANWTDITGNLPNGPVRSLTLFPPTSLVFLGTDAGVFATNQVQVAATQWFPYASGMPNAQVVDLDTAILPGTQGVLAAGTHGRGVYEVQVPNLVTINSFTPPIGVLEGNAYIGLFLGTFSASNPNLGAGDYTATLTWGDGVTDTLTRGNGGIEDLGGGFFRLRDNHTFRQAGFLPVQVAISANATDYITTRASGTATVVDAPLTITVLAPTTVEGLSIPITLARFLDGNPNADINDFTAYVDYSPGGQRILTAANGGIVAAFGGLAFSIIDNPTFINVGNIPFSVTVVSSGGSRVTGNGTINVADAPLTLTTFTPPANPLVGMSTGLLTLATFFDASIFSSPSNFTATVFWGDGTSSTLTFANGGIVYAGGSVFNVVAEHRYVQEANPGSFQIDIQDVGGGFLTRSAPIYVRAPLTITAFNPPTSAVVGQPTGPLTLATWTDVDPNMTAGDFSVVVSWGDGTTDTLTAANGGIVDNGDGTFSPVADHTYTQSILPFAYAFIVTVQDANGASRFQLGSVVVRQPTATALGANPNPSVAGQPVTFIATVTPGGCDQATPTGTVTFKDGETVLAAVPLGSVSTVYPFATLTARALAGWYKGPDPLGRALDSGGINNGTPQGSVTPVPGQVGTAFSFNGASYMRVPHGLTLLSLEPSTLTLEAWVKAAAPGTYRYVVSKGANGGAGASYALSTGGGGLSFSVYDGAGTVVLSPDAGSGVWDDTWHHVVGTYDGSAVRLYVDGVQVGDGSPTTLHIGYRLPTTNDFFIGTYNGGLNFTGAVDEVKLYNRALAANEIQAGYDAGLAGLTSNNAFLVIPTIPAGMHSITVTYNGNATFGPSRSGSPVVWPVFQAATTTALASSGTAALSGQPVTFTATISVAGPGSTDVAPPDGTVTFADGLTILGTAPLSTSNGVTTATFSTSSLAVGAHRITAAYAGDANFHASSTVQALDQTITEATASRRLVAQLYLDLLRRDVDAVGLRAWSGLLDLGSSTADVVRGLLASVEHRRLVVQDLYRRFLRREAEAFGLGVFTTFLGAGGTTAQVEALIVGSSEFYQRQGGGSDTGFLAAVYRDVLGRQTDAQGRRNFGQALSAGARPGDVAAAVFASPEFLGRLVESLYPRYLGRPSDPLGQAAFMDALQGGVSQEEVLTAILSSPEYAGGR